MEHRRRSISPPVLTDRKAALPAFLLAAARAKGITANALIREAVNRIIAEVPGDASVKKEPTSSIRVLLVKYRPAPSAEEIEENRAEMFANFPRDNF